MSHSGSIYFSESTTVSCSVLVCRNPSVAANSIYCVNKEGMCIVQCACGILELSLIQDLCNRNDIQLKML